MVGLARVTAVEPEHDAAVSLSGRDDLPSQRERYALDAAAQPVGAHRRDTCGSDLGLDGLGKPSEDIGDSGDPADAAWADLGGRLGDASRPLEETGVLGARDPDHTG